MYEIRVSFIDGGSVTEIGHVVRFDDELVIYGPEGGRTTFNRNFVTHFSEAEYLDDESATALVDSPDN